jgi:hypothetical protein
MLSALRGRLQRSTNANAFRFRCSEPGPERRLFSRKTKKKKVRPTLYIHDVTSLTSPKMGDYFPPRPPHKKQRDAVINGRPGRISNRHRRRDCTVLYAPFSPTHNCTVITCCAVSCLFFTCGIPSSLTFVSLRVRLFLLTISSRPRSGLDWTGLDLRLSLSHSKQHAARQY